MKIQKSRDSDRVDARCGGPSYFLFNKLYIYNIYIYISIFQLFVSD